MFSAVVDITVIIIFLPRMTSYSIGYEDWLRGWREWARTRKRGKMAQFIVEKLEEGVSVK